MTDHPKPARAPSSSTGGERWRDGVIAKMTSLMQAQPDGRYLDATETWNTLLEWLRSEPPAPASSPSALVERLRERVEVHGVEGVVNRHLMREAATALAAAESRIKELEELLRSERETRKDYGF